MEHGKGQTGAARFQTIYDKGAISLRSTRESRPASIYPKDFTILPAGEVACGTESTPTLPVRSFSWLVAGEATERITVDLDNLDRRRLARVLEFREQLDAALLDLRHTADLAIANELVEYFGSPATEPNPRLCHELGHLVLWQHASLAPLPSPSGDFIFAASPSATAKDLGVGAVSFVVKRHWLGSVRRSAKRAARRAFSRAAGRASRPVRDRLARVLKVLLGLAERPQRLREFVCKHKPWHVLHGAHPPRLSALAAMSVSGPLNRPGRAAA